MKRERSHRISLDLKNFGPPGCKAFPAQAPSVVEQINNAIGSQGSQYRLVVPLKQFEETMTGSLHTCFR